VISEFTLSLSVATSGSGFYTYALAWGVNQGLLDRNSEVSVKERVGQISRQLGDEIVIRHFVCFQVGEATV
jgi:hypothetical protein